MVIATTATADIGNPKEAGLTARLLRIQPVSWRWNAKGLFLHFFSKNIFKPWNRTEIGVIAQNARDELIDYYPEIAIKNRVGAWTIDYGMLSNIAYDNLVYLDAQYHELTRQSSNEVADTLNLQSLMDKYRTDDMQLMAVRLLSLVRVYIERIEYQSSPVARLAESRSR